MECETKIERLEPDKNAGMVSLLDWMQQAGSKLNGELLSAIRDDDDLAAVATEST